MSRSLDDARDDAGDMILGTAAFMSPEQARRTTADKRADLWKLRRAAVGDVDREAPVRGSDSA
jgi:serine/threonine protein kinase